MWEWRWGVVGRMRSWFLGMSRGGWGGFRLFLVLFCFCFDFFGWKEGREMREWFVGT